MLQDLQDGLQDQGTMFLPSEYLGLMFQRNVSRFLGLFGSCLPSAWGRKSLHICFEETRLRQLRSCKTAGSPGTDENAGEGMNSSARCLHHLGIKKKKFSCHGQTACAQGRCWTSTLSQWSRRDQLVLQLKSK